MADFFLDADIDDRSFIPLLEAKLHTAWPTQQVGRRDAPDDEQLLRATDLGRLLETHNRRDFLLLARAWRSLSQRWGVEPPHHAGIIVIPQPGLIPLTRSAAEIDNLMRSQRDVWGHVFDYDRRWGWVMTL